MLHHSHSLFLNISPPHLHAGHELTRRRPRAARSRCPWTSRRRTPTPPSRPTLTAAPGPRP
eukprot:2234968-Rhodomonas_salina.1